MSEPTGPVLRIVRGEPTAEELAVVTAVVTATSSGDGGKRHEPVRGRWNDPAATHRPVLRPGPGAWRAARN